MPDAEGSDEVLAQRAVEEPFMPLDVNGAVKVLTGFYKADGTEVTFYVTHPEAVSYPVLQDACQFLKDADNSGVILRPSVLTGLVKSYGLKVSSDFSLFDDQTGDLEERKYRFTQCLIGLDAILRMWGAAAPVRIDPEME